MATLKLRAIGNSVGVVLPKELLTRLNIGEGDTLHVIEAPDGLRLKRSDPAFERQMEEARRVMRRRRAVLRELAK
jgi:putative addiction module antidote